jgi:hypothetical protein
MTPAGYHLGSTSRNGNGTGKPVLFPLLADTEILEQQ